MTHVSIRRSCFNIDLGSDFDAATDVYFARGLERRRAARCNRIGFHIAKQAGGFVVENKVDHGDRHIYSSDVIQQNVVAQSLKTTLVVRTRLEGEGSELVLQIQGNIARGIDDVPLERVAVNILEDAVNLAWKLSALRLADGECTSRSDSGRLNSQRIFIAVPAFDPDWVKENDRYIILTESLFALLVATWVACAIVVAESNECHVIHNATHGVRRLDLLTWTSIFGLTLKQNLDIASNSRRQYRWLSR